MKELHKEFQQSFWMYVRPDEESVMDGRPAAVSKLLDQDFGTIVEMMADTPHDLAVLLSDSVSVSNPASFKKWMDLKNVKQRRDVFLNEKSLPLNGANERVTLFLDFLAKPAEGEEATPTKGQIMYIAIASCLIFALLQSKKAEEKYSRDMKPFLASVEQTQASQEA